MVGMIIAYLELLIIQNFNFSKSPLDLNMLASAQYSSALACSSFCLGKLWPLCRPVCHCASLPSPRATVHFTVSLVRPAKKGLRATEQV